MIPFQRFLPEIQDIIWRCAIAAEKPRNVQLRLRSLNQETPRKCCTSTASIPSLLHACTRARELSKERWQLSFREHEEGLLLELPPHVPRVWFDHELDTLLLVNSSPNCTTYENITVLNRHESPIDGTRTLKRLAFDLEDLHVWEMESYTMDPPDSPVDGDEDDSDEEGGGNRVMEIMCEQYPGLTDIFFVTNIDYGRKFVENGDLEVVDLTEQELRTWENYKPIFVEAYKKWSGVELRVEFVSLALRES